MTIRLIDRPRILVLGDIQIGDWGEIGAKHIPQERKELEAEKWAVSVLTLLERTRTRVDLVVLPGDLSSTGIKDEFHLLRVFLDTLFGRRRSCPSGASALAPIGVVMCPGNHDVCFANSEDPYRRFEHYLEFARAFYRDYWAQFGQNKISVAPWLNLTSSVETFPTFADLVDARNLWTIYSFEHQLNLYAVSLNSAEQIILKTPPGGTPKLVPETAFGYVGQEVFDLVEDGIERLGFRRRNVRSIATMHHNIVHARPVDPTKELHPGEVYIPPNYLAIVQGLQRSEISFLIHGHQHEPFLTGTALFDSPDLRASRQLDPDNITPMKADPKPLLVFGAGSFSVARKETYANRFHVLDYHDGDPTTEYSLVYKTYQFAKGLATINWKIEYSNSVPGHEAIWPDKRTLSQSINRSLVIDSQDWPDSLDRLAGAIKASFNGDALAVDILELPGLAITGTTPGTHLARVLQSSAAGAEQIYFRNAFRCEKDQSRFFIFKEALVGLEVYARDEALERDFFETDQSFRLKKPQLRLGRVEKLFGCTLIFEIEDGERLGVRVFFTNNEGAERAAYDASWLHLRNYLVVLRAYWKILEGGDLLSGRIHDELTCPDTGINATAHGTQFRGPAAPVWSWGLEKIEGTDLQKTVLTDEYWRFENLLYQKKKRIERYIIYSVLENRIVQLRRTLRHSSDLLQASAAVLSEISVKTKFPRADAGGRIINPLLVSFWRPVPKRASDSNDETPGLRFALTRDQLTACLANGPNEPSGEHVREMLGKVAHLLSAEMRNYQHICFDGMSAYVQSSGSSVLSHAAYNDPLVKFEAGSEFERDVPSAILRKYRERSDMRRRLTEIERQLWNVTDDCSVYVLPMWGEDGVRGVLQIQTLSGDLIECLNRSQFEEISDVLRAPDETPTARVG